MSSKPAVGNAKALQREDASGVPEDERARRRSVLEAAKQRAKQRGGRPQDMTGTPRFDQVQEQARAMRPAPGHDTPPPLSKQTTAALEAVAAANRQETGEAEAPEETEDEVSAIRDVDGIADVLGVDLRTARRILEVINPGKDAAAAARAAVEARCGKIDIGEFLMNGTVSQKVPIVVPGLEITYQTVPDLVEAHVDRLLAEEAAKIRKVRDGDNFVDSEMSQREYVRRQNEFALVAHIRSYNGTTWPTLVKPDGNIDENAVTKRLALVRQLVTPIFGLAINNLSWFLERVQDALDVAVLGNG